MKTPFLTRLLATLLVSSFILPPSAFAQTASPTLIPFQGQLTNQQGVAYTAGQYTIVFNLYSQAVGGTAIWTERHQKVGVINGMVNVFLGSIQAFGTVDFSQVNYLGITIDADDNPVTADPEMVPRQMIIPAFSAKTAEKMTAFNASTGQSLGVSYGWSAIFDNGNPATGKFDGAKLANTSVTTAQLAANAVTATQLAANSVTTAKLAAGSIDGTKLAPSAVSSTTIADGAIAEADLNSSVQQSLVPAGSITAFAGAGPTPAGWLFCDGSALKSSDYPRLYSAIATQWGNGTQASAGALSSPIAGQTNFNLPDLRGYFLRGRDGGTARDPDWNSALLRPALLAGGATANSVGSYQNDAFKSHTHNFLSAASPYQIYGYPVQDEKYLTLTSRPDLTQEEEYNQGILSTGGSETRPKNAYVNYIIKY